VLTAVTNKLNNNNGRQKTDDDNNNIIKTNHYAFTKKKLSSVVAALLISMLLISISAISMPSYLYGQTTTATTAKNTLKVITQVVCPPNHTCPKASDFKMRFKIGQDPKPSSVNGSSSGVDVKLGDGNYEVEWSTRPVNPSGLVLYPGYSPSCRATISGGESKTCIALMAYATNVDTDKDGIPDSWETNGIPYNGTDGALHYYTLSGASTTHKDVYVEVDYMQNHRPIDAALTNVKNVFAGAPVTNPDGKGGITIQYLLSNTPIPHEDAITFNDFEFKLKPLWFGTTAERQDANANTLLAAKSIIYHYVVFAHNQPPSPGRTTGSMGTANRPGMNVLISLGNNAADDTGHKVGSLNDQETTFMHELGHNLGLSHGGGDFVNCKPNYISVMNYAVDLYVATAQLSYSKSALPSLDKDNLNEQAGLGQSDPPGLRSPFGPVTAGKEVPFATADGSPVDWNQNNVTTDSGVKADINGGIPGAACPASASDSPKVLNGYNDWANIVYISDKASDSQSRINQQEQTLPMEKEPTIDDVRQARLALLQGVNNDIEQIKSGQTTGQANPIKETVFEIQNLIGVLKKQGFSPPSTTAGAAAPTSTTTAPTTTTSPGLAGGMPGTSPSLPPEVTALMQNPTGGMSVDMNNVAQSLKTDELGNAVGQLDKLLAEVSTMASSSQSQSQQQLQQLQLQQQPQQQPQLQPPPSSLSSSSTSPSQTPIANAGISQTVDANATVMLDGRNSQPAKPGTSITAYQWTQLPTPGAVPVNLIGGPSIPTPMFIAPTLPYDTTLSFGLKVLASDGSVSTNDAVAHVMVKGYTGPMTSAGGGSVGTPGAFQQPPGSQLQLQQPQQPLQQQQPIFPPQQQLPGMGQQQQPASPNLQQQPNLPSATTPPP